MSPATALRSPGHAAELLERIVFERVLELLDAKALYRLEQQLARELARVGMNRFEVCDVAAEMISRALREIADDESARYEIAGVCLDDCARVEAELTAERERHGPRRDCP